MKNFLHQLTFQQDAGDNKPLTKFNIEKYGKSIRENNGDKGSDFLIGQVPLKKALMMKNKNVFCISMVFENMFVRFLKVEKLLLESENKSIIY